MQAVFYGVGGCVIGTGPNATEHGPWLDGELFLRAVRCAERVVIQQVPFSDGRLTTSSTQTRVDSRLVFSRSGIALELGVSSVYNAAG